MDDQSVWKAIASVRALLELVPNSPDGHCRLDGCVEWARRTVKHGQFGSVAEFQTALSEKTDAEEASPPVDAAVLALRETIKPVYKMLGITPEEPNTHFATQMRINHLSRTHRADESDAEISTPSRFTTPSQVRTDESDDDKVVRFPYEVGRDGEDLWLCQKPWYGINDFRAYPRTLGGIM